MSVLWNLEIDRMAMAMAGIADAKNRTGFPGDPHALWEQIAANITEVRGHPAIGGSYACDDCCHMTWPPSGPTGTRGPSTGRRRPLPGR